MIMNSPLTTTVEHPIQPSGIHRSQLSDALYSQTSGYFEIDAPEALCNEPGTAGVGRSHAFHRYGVGVAQCNTSGDMHRPFYLIANSWPGPPNAQAMFAAPPRIPGIKVWQRPACATTAAQDH